MIKFIAACFFVLMAVNPAWAQLDRALKGLGGLSGAGSGSPNDAKIGSGLQEALKVGTENAVLQTGSVDGFFKNQAIKILMPRPLQNIEQPCVWSVTGRRLTSLSSA